MNFSIPKVSVVVPVYNAGKYFEQCMETLLNQTLREIEIILVLDCPTDGSNLRAKQYAQQDSRVIIIENEANLHVGYSRNRGLAIAKGEYIGFSDHDDYRLLTMYEEMYNRAKESNSDIVLSAYGSVSNKKKEEVFYPFSEENISNDFMFQLAVGVEAGTPENYRFFSQNGGMWNKLYRNELLKINNIKFVDNKKYTYEDLLFLIKCYFYARKISIINKVYYYHSEYRENTSSKYQYSSYKKMVKYLDELYHFLNQNNQMDVSRERFNNSVIQNVFISIESEIFFNKSIASLKELFREFKSRDYIQNAFRQSKSNTIGNENRYLHKKLLRTIISEIIKK